MPSPYGRHTRKRRPTRHTRKKGNATSRVVQRTRVRKSAAAQASQIRTVARSVLNLQRSRKDAFATTRWQTKQENMLLSADSGTGLSVNKGIFFFPLTSGPSAVAAAAQSSLAAASINDMAWLPVQPEVGDGNDGNAAGSAWIKLYTQHCKMCFYQNDMNRGNKFKCMVVRLAREDETQLDNTMLSRLTSIDGIAFKGHPDTDTRFQLDSDYYSCKGYRGPTPTDIGGTDANGHTLVTLNNQRYVVEFQKEFALGRSLGPTPTTAAIGPTSGGSSTQNARDYQEMSWSINYGGAKLMAPDTNQAAGQEGKSAITIQDVTYADIDPKLKRWLVIFPQRTCAESSNTGVPVISYLSTVTCKVPAT